MSYICRNVYKNTGYKLDMCPGTDVMTVSYVGLVRSEIVGVEIVFINPHQTVRYYSDYCYQWYTYVWCVEGRPWL